MTEPINRADAGRALDDIDLRRRQIVAEIDVPAWYWWGLALGWVGLGLVTVAGIPWLLSRLAKGPSWTAGLITVSFDPYTSSAPGW